MAHHYFFPLPHWSFEFFKPPVIDNFETQKFYDNEYSKKICGRFYQTICNKKFITG
jgi:hypothetical protein